MVSFANTGDWFKESGLEPLEKFVPPRRYCCLLNVIGFSLFTIIPYFYLAGKVLLSANLIHISLLTLPIVIRECFDIRRRKKTNTFEQLFVFFSVYLASSKLIDVSEISKTSSTYGTDKSKAE